MPPLMIRKIFYIFTAVLICILAADVHAKPAPGITPTIFLKAKNGRLHQVVRIALAGNISGKFNVETKQFGVVLKSKVQIMEGAKSFTVLVPACAHEACSTTVKIKNDSGAVEIEKYFDLPYQRQWKIYVSPYSHIDVGFTNCQKKKIGPKHREPARGIGPHR